MNFQKEIHEYIISKKDEMIKTLSELVSIRSIKESPKPGMPFGEMPAKALEKALSICGDAGFITENTYNYVGSADLNTLEPELAVLCHLDVVPEGSGWNTDPYTLTEKGGRLYGRGAIDNKGPATAAIYAMKAIKELNIPVKKGVRLIFGTDEENGSSDLKYYMSVKKMPPMVFTPDGSYPVINIEKGMIRLNITAELAQDSCTRKIISIKGGEAVNAVAGYAEAELSGFTTDEISNGLNFPDKNIQVSVRKSGKNTIISVTGVCAHASTPQLGSNAITALLKLLSELPIESTSQTSLINSLCALYPYGETDGSSLGIKCSDEISGELTLVPGVIDFSEKKLDLKNDIRFPLSKTSSDIICKVNEKLSSCGLDTEILIQDEPHCTDESSPFVQTLLKVYESVTGEKGFCLAIGGGTYVHNIPGGVAFGAEFLGEENNMHGADESISIDNLLKTAEITACAIAELIK